MTMKRKIILRLSFLIAFLTLLWSCRNEDFIQAEKNPQRNNRDFFKHSKKGGAFAKTTLDYVDILEAYNREKNFLSAMPDQEGMPIWDKMRIVKTENSTSLVIPLSEDNATMSSVFFALIDNKENTVKAINNITNDELRRVVFDPSIDVQKRESLFCTFMATDNYTFGNEVFSNIPQDLFVDDKLGEQNNRIVFHAPRFGDALATETTTQNGRVQVVYEVICVIIRHCTHHGSGACDGCNICQTESCSHSTTLVFTYPDPETGVVIYGYPEGGGGGGTPLPIPDPDPCGLSRAFYRVAPNCNGSTPVTLPQDHCENLKNLLKPTKANIKPIIQNLQTKLNDTIEHGNSLQKSFAGVYSNIVVPPGTSSEVTLNAGTLFYGVIHTHQYPGAVPMFSWTDVYSLYFLYQNVYNPHNSEVVMMVVCKDDNGNNQIYAIKIDDPQQLLNALTSDMSQNPKINSNTSEAKIFEFMNAPLTKLYADTSPNREGTFLERFANFGISLYKANDGNNVTNWNKLTLENGNVVSTLCN
ncbi:hypothetical protein SAMN05421785_106126 [Chryseobacterium gambrini]|uniref:Uncharacterized protein n=2 Tax=Chryseobacterium gambrini TaxID=373672 RepID=A0A1N7PBI5_9FLAO|nr:hypothetical protein SAMN05421785_106126 [Chryseobacterium gambrini]